MILVETVESLLTCTCLQRSSILFQKTEIKSNLIVLKNSVGTYAEMILNEIFNTILLQYFCEYLSWLRI